MILVHCMAGVSRSATVSSIVLIAILLIMLLEDEIINMNEFHTKASSLICSQYPYLGIHRPSPLSTGRPGSSACELCKAAREQTGNFHDTGSGYR